MGDQYDEILDRMDGQTDPVFDLVWNDLEKSLMDSLRRGRRSAYDQRTERFEDAMSRFGAGPARPRTDFFPPAPEPEAPAPEPEAPSRPRRSQIPRRPRTTRATSQPPTASLRPAMPVLTPAPAPEAPLPEVTSSPPSRILPATEGLTPELRGAARQRETEPEPPAPEPEEAASEPAPSKERTAQELFREVQHQKRLRQGEASVAPPPPTDPKAAKAAEMFAEVQERKRARQESQVPPEAEQGEGPITPPKRDKDSSSNLNEQLSAAIQGGDADALRTLLSTKEAEIAETLGTENLANYKSALEQMESKVATEAGMEEVKRTSRKRSLPKENPVTQPVETAKKPEVAKPASKTDKRTNAQLREALKAKGLSTTGKKADLLARLNEADSEKAEEKPKTALSYAQRSKLAQLMFQGKAQGIEFFRDNPDELDKLTESQKKRFREVSEVEALQTPASKESKIKAAVKGKEPAKKAAKKKADSKKQENVDDELPSVSDKKAAKERTEQEDALSGKAPPPRRSSKKGK